MVENRMNILRGMMKISKLEDWVVLGKSFAFLLSKGHDLDLQANVYGRC